MNLVLMTKKLTPTFKYKGSENIERWNTYFEREQTDFAVSDNCKVSNLLNKNFHMLLIK